MPSEHGQEPVRPRAHERGARLPDQRTRSRDSRPWPRRRGAWRSGQLPGSVAGAGTGAAVQFAGCPHLVDAGDSSPGRSGLQAWTPGALDAVPDDGGFLRGRHSTGGHLDLPGRGRRRSGGAGELPSELDLRRNADRRALQVRPPGAGPRTGLFQDPARRRCRRRLGEVPRRHGRQCAREPRAKLHQLLRHLGVAPYGGDRAGDRRAAGCGATATHRPSGKPAGRVHGAGSGGSDLEDDRRAHRGSGDRGCHSGAPRWPADRCPGAL